MKNLNLGKIVLIISLLYISLFGSVTATLSQNAVYKGDVVNLTLSASGDDIKFPNINNIGAFQVIGVSNSSSTSIINGHISKSVSKIYSFIPTHSITIPSFKVKIDGKNEKTKELKLDVVKPSASKNGEPFVLEATLDKQNVRVGEEVLLTLKFKQKLNARAAKIEINEPSWDNIWVKRVGGASKSTQGDYIVTTYKYLLFPQKAGSFNLDNLFVSVATLHKQRMNSFFNDPFFDNFNTTVSYKKIYSKDLKLIAKSLPNGQDIYGDFIINVSVDKTRVNANKPVNLTLTIKGSGNIDDIKPFELDIPQAVVYADKPQIKTMLQNGKYKGIFTQKIALIANSNFTIPSIKFNYFSKNKQKIITIKSKPIDIKVLGNQNIAQSNISNNKSNTIQTNIHPKIELSKEISSSKVLNKVKNQNNINIANSYIIFVIGVLFGVVGTLLSVKLKTKKQKKEPSIITKINKVKKDDKKLFELLLPYKKQDNSIDEVLEQLEENLYNGKSHQIDLIKIIEYFYWK